jgi:hypothetical protein
MNALWSVAGGKKNSMARASEGSSNQYPEAGSASWGW